MGWYEYCAMVYLENPPSEGYMDVLARQAIAGGTNQMQELVVLLSGLAEFRSGKYVHLASRRGLDSDDLRQSAMCEMLAGLRTWNRAESSFKLHAFNLATKGIRDLLEHGGTVRIPYTTYRAAMGKQQRGRAPLKSKTRSAVLRALQHPLSLSVEASDEGGEPDYLMGRLDPDYDEVVAHLTIRQALKAAGITPEQRAALEAIYGEGGTQQQRVRKLATELKVSEYSIRHTARRSLRALRTTIATSEKAGGESDKDSAYKRCSECDDEKPVSEFYRTSQSGRPQSACKKCMNIRSARNKRRRRAALKEQQ